MLKSSMAIPSERVLPLIVALTVSLTPLLSYSEEPTLCSRGGFGAVTKTRNGHCLGHEVDLWEIGGQTIAVYTQHAGLCGDPTCRLATNPTLTERGELAFHLPDLGRFQGKIAGHMLRGHMDLERVSLSGELHECKPSPLYNSFTQWCGAYTAMSQCKGFAEFCSVIKNQLGSIK